MPRAVGEWHACRVSGTALQTGQRLPCLLPGSLRCTAGRQGAVGLPQRWWATASGTAPAGCINTGRQAEVSMATLTLLLGQVGNMKFIPLDGRCELASQDPDHVAEKLRGHLWGSQSASWVSLAAVHTPSTLAHHGPCKQHLPSPPGAKRLQRRRTRAAVRCDPSRSTILPCTGGVKARATRDPGEAPIAQRQT